MINTPLSKMLNSNYRSTVSHIVLFMKRRAKGASFNFCYLTDRLHIPILRNNPNFSLLIARHHCHENPILFKWSLTACSSVATCLVACGSGIS